MNPNFKNRTIFTGDNLDILRGMNSGCVDLVYLDPPFNSNRNYEAPIGSELAEAHFKDVWTLDDIDLAWHGMIAEEYPAIYQLAIASKLAHGKGMMSYLIYMAMRLLEIKRVLKDTGSIYLHVDPTASHYLKMIMDAVFGKSNFRNEIVWHYGKMSNSPKNFPQNHDIVLRYSKSDKYTFHPVKGAESEYRNRYHKFLTGNKVLYGSVKDKSDKLIKGRVKKRERELGRDLVDEDVLFDFDKEYKNQSDVMYVPILKGNSKERLGYPTQKPLALLERIIKASSNEGDVVLDPFCGSATTCIAAERLNRQWIGIDLSELAYRIVVDRMASQLDVDKIDVAHIDSLTRTDQGKFKKYNHADNRQTLYGKQEGDCAGCGHHFPYRNFTVDHIIPQSKGGTDHPDNLQLLCGACNSMKGDREHSYLVAELTRKGIIK